MENIGICIDTSVIIDYYRKKDKKKTLFAKLISDYKKLYISVITRFEILQGSNEEKDVFWKKFFNNIEVLPYANDCNDKAIEIYRQLKFENKMIELPDIFIAATDVSNNIPLATLNVKHFSRIAKLKLIK